MREKDNSGDNKKEALKSYLDLAKQQITIASALIAFTGTLLGVFLKSTGVTTPNHLSLTFISWGFLAASIVLGILFHGRSVVLTAEGNYDVDDRLLDWLGRAQQVLFVVGIIFLGIFAGINLASG
jgi:amino acid transporter